MRSRAVFRSSITAWSSWPRAFRRSSSCGLCAKSTSCAKALAPCCRLTFSSGPSSRIAPRRAGASRLARPNPYARRCHVRQSLRPAISTRPRSTNSSRNVVATPLSGSATTARSWESYRPSCGTARSSALPRPLAVARKPTRLPEEAYMQLSIDQKIREFIEDNFLFRTGRGDLAAEESLLDAGLIDSTGILELVAFLENGFGIVIEDAEIVPDNLDSIRAIAAYVERKLGAQSRAA